MSRTSQMEGLNPDLPFPEYSINMLTVVDLKVWKSNQLIEIQDSSNFEKFLRNMNSISTDGTENIEQINSISEKCPPKYGKQSKLNLKY